MQTNLIIGLLFGTTALLTAWFFYRALRHPFIPMVVLIAWCVLHSFLAANGFYLVTNTLPPRMALILAPVLIITAFMILSPAGKRFTQDLDLRWLTLLHTVRLPVEIGLFLLYRQKQIPQLMTFEGRNFDIIAGITAPLVYYFVFVKKSLSSRVLLAWNIICLGLLLNILINAVLSIPGPLQRFAFDQPNVGVLSFPVILLPALIVPLVLFAQVAAITQLLKRK